MAKPDPLVRWETAALRESAERRGAAPAARPTAPHITRSHKKEAWVTLRDAHYETGLPIETLRKWARRRHIPSEVRTTEYGERRMIDLAAAEERARRLGRPLRPVPPDQREEHEPRSPDGAAMASSEAAVVDLRGHQDASPPADASGTEPELPAPEAPRERAPAAVEETSAADEIPPDPTEGAPPGTMIVPIAAWDRMLMQLGNLHQAGQQLADARERAAKAETEATFLRERLAELRERLEKTQAASDPSPPPDSNPSQPPSAEPAETMWRYVVRGWRERRRTS